MQPLFIRRLSWQARQYLGAIGAAGIAALLLCGACAGFAYFAFLPLQARIATLQKDTAHLRAQSRLMLPIAPGTGNPAAQLAQFYNFFPGADTLANWMGKLYDAGAQQGLTLAQGEYRLVHDRNGKLLRYEIGLPVKGTYPQVRKFLAQVLSEVPTLSLDGIAFNRDKINDPMVEAQITLTLYLGEKNAKP